MFAGIRKNIQTGYLNYIIGLLLFLLLFLSIGSDLFHNHKPDLECNDDCPAFHIYLLFSSTIIFYFIFWFILAIFTILILIRFNSNYLFTRRTNDSRAPPFQISENLNYNSKQNRILHHQNLKPGFCVKTKCFH